MSAFNPAVFREQYKDGVIRVFQQQGWKTKGIFRRHTGITGDKAKFTLASPGKAVKKARGGKIPPMNRNKRFVDVQLEPQWAREDMEITDAKRLTHDDRTLMFTEIGEALGRACDQVPIDAMADANVAQVQGDYSTALGPEMLMNALNQLDANNVNISTENAIHCVCRETDIQHMMTWDVFANADYKGDSGALPFRRRCAGYTPRGARVFAKPLTTHPGSALGQSECRGRRRKAAECQRTAIHAHSAGPSVYHLPKPLGHGAIYLPQYSLTKASRSAPPLARQSSSRPRVDRTGPLLRQSPSRQRHRAHPKAPGLDLVTSEGFAFAWS